MSQSPEAAVRRARYEDGWEAINRMIREDGSWSGRERNCFHLGCDDGTFVDASAASGLDRIEDGRAFAVLDHDGDGDPDIFLRNRNGPRLVALRNRFASGNASLWLHLSSPGRNKEAVGARVEVRTERGTRVKEVEVGSGFLSQHSRWLHFGLGSDGKVLGVRVRWPGGSVEEYTGIAPGRRWRIVEGGEPLGEPYRPHAAPSPPPALLEEPPQSSPEAQVWLVDPLQAPDLRLPDLDGKERTLSSHRGKPLVLLFLSPGCGACVEEVEELRGGARAIAEAGAAILGVAFGSAEERASTRTRFAGAPFPVLLADAAAAAAWNGIHRGLFNRYRDLAVPTTFLIDAAGRIQKVVRGRTSPDSLAADIRRLASLTDPGRLELALPFPGTLLGPPFRRDLFLLGAGLLEGGAAGPAAEALEGALGGGGSDPEALYNLGMALADSGNAEGAAQAYRRALEARPEMVDARNNLGVLEARAGRLAEARAQFERILAEQPGHGEAALNIAGTFIQEGLPAVAVERYREGLRHDPESHALWRSLGYALHLDGRPGEAIAAYRRALSLSPTDADAVVGLANLLLQRGGREDLPEARRIVEEGARRHPRNVGLLNALGLALAVHEDFAGAESAYERAIAADPESDGPYLNLARLRLLTGDRGGAAQCLRRLLQVHPDHPQARKMLEEMREPASR